MELINHDFNEIVTINGRDYLIVGLSARGTFDKPNQDSYGYYYDGERLIVAIADGLGSAIKSEIGSASAVRAALQLLSKPSYDDIWNNMFSIWSSMVEKPFVQYDTTCKFFGIDENKAIIGSIGDGWFGVQTIEKYDELHNNCIFTNCTQTICTIKEGHTPYYAELDSNIIRSVVLATDGFSEDFDYGGRESMLGDMMQEACADTNGLFKDLHYFMNNWPVTTNHDDKTIVFIGRVS